MSRGRRRVISIAAVLLLLAGAFAAGGLWAGRGAAEPGPERAVTYACPMHPQYRSDHAGDCPACGMRLEPAREGATSARSGALPGTVSVSAERQQAVGVRLGVAQRVSGTRMLRTTGRVAADENLTYPIVAGGSGWIREIGRATSGARVKRHEVLASLYVPDIVLEQQAYYSALDTLDRVGSQQLQARQTRVVEGVERLASTLRNLGVPEPQLAEMTRDRRVVQEIRLTSPVDGFVLQRNVSPGLRFDRGFELYRIADLRRVWILADVYQHQLPFIQAGSRARFTTAQATHPLAATVSGAEPVFDEQTLTLKVRLDCDNPGLLLKPGMFVDVELPITLPETLAVPADAIVDSGLRKTVFVDLGDGTFEPRQVETGWRIAGDVQVLKGLMAGERIVISGTFLVDSESRMKAAAQGIFGAASEDPVCGMQVDEQRAAAAGRKAAHGGRTYYFCAEECKRAFEKDPDRYLRAGEPAPGDRPQVTEPARHMLPAAGAADHATAAKASTAVIQDPICGMQVNVAEAAAAGRTSRHAGRTFAFCSDHCKETFDADPARFMEQGR